MSKISLSSNILGTGTLTIASPNTDSDFTLSLPATTAPILAGSGITLSASAPANTLVTTDAGNVGIGTGSPATKLEVTGDITQTWAASADRFVGSKFSTTYELGLHFIEASRETRIVSKAADSSGLVSFYTGTTPTERMRVDSAGNVGIGTDAPTAKLDVAGSVYFSGIFRATVDGTAAQPSIQPGPDNDTGIYRPATNVIGFSTAGTERARIDSSGNLLVGKTTSGSAVVGCESLASGVGVFASDGATNAFIINRISNDGTLISLRQANTQEGTISVSGTTVSYNGGHLSRWAQTTTAKDESLVKGTVLSNLDEMNVYTDAEGNTVENEQLNKVKVSDVEGDANVAGVFVNWDYDEAHNVDEINMAMTGDMIIRIAAGTTVARGDLLMSAGDGTAKPQGDDIVRSKTIAKVTSTHVTCTYADGSFCVPCVLMAC